MIEPNFVLDSYKAIFNYILDPIVIYQVDDQYRFHKMMMINDSFRRSYGYEMQEVLEADFSIINANPSKVPDLIFSICEAGSILFETLHRNKEGEEFPVEVHSHCVKANDNPIVVSIIRNISDRKRDQSELFHMQEARSKTLKLMSHDLRNSLAQIASALILLNEYSFERNIQDLIDILGEAHKNANRLLMDHLSDSDDPSDSFKLDLLPFDLSELSSRLAAKYSVLAQTEKGIELVVQLPETSALIEGDQFKLNRVLDNVMGNAIKFSSRGSKIYFGILLKDEMVRFSIKDHGMGIPISLQPTVFQASPGRTGTEGERSNGLGLYISKKIVDMHQGHIWFETQENEGTAFHIEIPRKFNT